MSQKPRNRLLALLGPGLLVAATGVGAGDLATGALSGARLGVAVLWAVVLGAAIKFALNEGLARWQLATDTTVLEGVTRHFGRLVIAVFLVYLCVWSFFVGSALMSACGIAAHAIAPLFGPGNDKVFYGLLHSAAALVMVRLGGYRLFERVMGVCIGVMFVTVVISAVAVQPDWGAVAAGLFVPGIPEADGTGLRWTIGLMGGVGGTVTVLCYGYWIREEGRRGLGELGTCRIDLATGYFATAVFGIGMVILGSRLDVDVATKGATLIVQLAAELESAFGAAGPGIRVVFLVGAWGAVASSMLGVWQAVPYLFADCWSLLRGASGAGETRRAVVDDRHPVYRASLYALAIVPSLGLFAGFARIQLAYAIVGAAFMPILAFGLLLLNGSRSRIGAEGRNPLWVTCVLVGVIAFFAWAGFLDVRARFQ